MAQGTIKPKQTYDKDADVLYVRFVNDQEPTYVENVDDIMLLEIGWFSGLPKGFRILGPKYHKIDAIQMAVITRIKKQVRKLMEQKRKAIKEQEPIFTNIFDKLPSIFESVR